MNLEQDLRITSDEMERILEQLQRLEHEKRAELPGTARFGRLATEIEKLAAMVAQTNTQQSLGEENRVVGARGATLTPIDEVAPARDVSVVLTEWREAERRVSTSAVESYEHATAAADARRLREEYHRTYRSHSESKRGS